MLQRASNPTVVYLLYTICIFISLHINTDYNGIFPFRHERCEQKKVSSRSVFVFLVFVYRICISPSACTKWHLRKKNKFVNSSRKYYQEHCVFYFGYIISVFLLSFVHHLFRLLFANNTPRKNKQNETNQQMND